MKIHPVIWIELDQMIEVRESLIEPVFVNTDHSTYRAIDRIVGTELDRLVKIAAGVLPVAPGARARYLPK